MKNKRLSLLTALLASAFVANVSAQDLTVTGPDKKLQVKIALKQGGVPNYSVTYNGKTMLEDSPLGLTTNVGDFSKSLTYIGHKETAIDETYSINRAKTSQVRYTANELVATFQNDKKQQFDIVFRVGNNDVAFKYHLNQYGETARLIVEKEASGFDFPAHATTFLTPQATPMIGWMRTKPSYEEEYVADDALGKPSQYGVGYTFPGLFRSGGDGWVLVSETGVSSAYCGSKLSEGTQEGLYTVA